MNISSNIPSNKVYTSSATPSSADAHLGARLGQNLEAAAHKIVQGTEATAHRIAESAAALGAKSEVIGDKIHEKIEGAKEGFSAGKEAAAEMVGDLVDRAGSMTDRIGNYVRANPAKSVAIGVVAALVLSRLFSSRQAR